MNRMDKRIASASFLLAVVMSATAALPAFAQGDEPALTEIDDEAEPGDMSEALEECADQAQAECLIAPEESALEESAEGEASPPSIDQAAPSAVEAPCTTESCDPGGSTRPGTRPDR